MDLKYAGRLLLVTEEGFTVSPNTGESHTPLHFRQKFLPVSLALKVLICTFKFLYIFETLADINILYTCMNSARKALLSSPVEVRGTKKS